MANLAGRQQPETVMTARLKLRLVHGGDTERIAELGGDWDVASMTSRMPHPYSLDAARQWVDSLEDDEYVRAIEHRGGLVGICGYLPDGSGAAEIGYWLGKPYWGNGFATEAASELVLQAFRYGRFERLTGGHFVDNPASARVMVKLGFKCTGPYRTWCEARGSDTDAIGYELSGSEFRRGRSGPFSRWMR